MSEDGATKAQALGPLDGVVFDTDGVITRTVDAHRASWKHLFDDYLARRDGDGFEPFSEEDYLAHVDGRPRYDGVEGFLASRGIELARGLRTDAPDAETICGLGNRKNEYFRVEVDRHGVEVYDSTLALMGALRGLGAVMAAVSASENQRLVLEAAGVVDAFDVVVDGVMAQELGLAGKPDPALFLEAADRLGVVPARVAVVEDARAGVAAGRAGDFGAVIGVNRGNGRADLHEAGADVVVDDLDELTVRGAVDGGCWLEKVERS